MKNLTISMLLGMAATTTGMVLVSTPANAANISSTGSFGTNPNAIESFLFTADGTSTVTIRSYGWGGGVNAQGNTIAAGGFDPVLTLFNATTGAYILDTDDDIGLDFNLVEVLTPGSYRAVLSVFGNYANNPFPGGNFADGFTNTGDFFGRTSAYAVDILNVNNTTPTAVPEPFTVIGTLIGGTAALRMRKKLKSTAKA
jgi:hypothetical protein